MVYNGYENGIEGKYIQEVRREVQDNAKVKKYNQYIVYDFTDLELPVCIGNIHEVMAFLKMKNTNDFYTYLHGGNLYHRRYLICKCTEEDKDEY